MTTEIFLFRTLYSCPYEIIFTMQFYHIICAQHTQIEQKLTDLILLMHIEKPILHLPIRTWLDNTQNYLEQKKKKEKDSIGQSLHA